MASFSRLQKFEVQRDITVPFPLYHIDESDGEAIPTLHVVSATEANKAYFNQVLQRTAGRVRTMNNPKALLRLHKENQQEDVALYAECVVKGWENIVDDAGEVVAFSAQNAKDFLGQLLRVVPRQFEDLRAFCGNAENFVGVTADQIEETAGN